MIKIKVGEKIEYILHINIFGFACLYKKKNEIIKKK